MAVTLKTAKRIDFQDKIMEQNLGCMDDANYSERFVFTKSKKNKYTSFLSHLRNAFAHGHFVFQNFKNEIYLFLKDVRNNNTLTMRGAIKYSSLVCLVEIISREQNQG